MIEKNTHNTDPTIIADRDDNVKMRQLSLVVRLSSHYIQSLGMKLVHFLPIVIAKFLWVLVLQQRIWDFVPTMLVLTHKVAGSWNGGLRSNPVVTVYKEIILGRLLKVLLQIIVIFSNLL